VPEVKSGRLEGQDIPLDVRYEDGDVVVLVKPSGMAVHPSRGHRDGTLVNALIHRYPGLLEIGGEERPGIVHRLDLGTSGVLVVALHDVALRRLQAQFYVHSVTRRYFGLVYGAPDEERGAVRSTLARHPKDRVRMASTQGEGKRAVTHWRVRGRGEGLTWVECQLETGRTHQVRVHLSEMGHGLLGDTLYRRGHRPLPPPVDRALSEVDHQLLHAAHLSFEHPVSGERLTFEAPVPADFRAVADAAGLPVP
jgi:23S rRNA pseudouridine1911/1915/1917 synthase